MYIFHQKEFFPIALVNSDHTFFGYKEKRQAKNSGAGVGFAAEILFSSMSNPLLLIIIAPVAIAVGVTVGIVKLSTSSNYKKHRVEYAINSASGEVERLRS